MRTQRKRFSSLDARRWFSSTMRTRARPLRELETDEAQLARYGLPLWRTEADIAQALGDRRAGRLRHFSVHSARDRSSHYVTFAIPKRTGGERLIMAPKSRLKALQRRLQRAAGEQAADRASTRTASATGTRCAPTPQPHVGKGVVLRLDIKDFFPSIHFGRVRGLLIALGYGYPVATMLAVLMTEAPRQPVSGGRDAILRRRSDRAPARRARPPARD